MNPGIRKGGQSRQKVVRFTLDIWHDNRTLNSNEQDSEDFQVVLYVNNGIFLRKFVKGKKLYFTQEPDDARYEKTYLPWSGHFTAGKTTSLSMR